jgi:hypothetical protein
MTCRQRWFKRALADARERRHTMQVFLAKGVKLGEYRAALLPPFWYIAKWNGHHWRVFDRTATLATLQWRYGGKHPALG